MVTSKKDLLMNSLSLYFKNNDNILKFIEIITQKSSISLRIIDWFVTNYAKKNNTTFDINNIPFIVFLNYKDQLKAYSKKLFDPFQRRERIDFIYNNNNEIIETTIGQLNFFKWCFENNIIEYVENNISLIEKDMNTSIHKTKRSKTKKILNTDDNIVTTTTRKKRQTLSVSATRTFTKSNVKITIRFD